MKKFFSYLLVAVMCLSLFAGCGNKPSKELEAARSYLFNLYKDKQGTTTADFDVVSILNVDGAKYTVAWAVDNTAKVALNAGDKFTTVDLDEKSPEAFSFTITGTITNEKGKTISQDFTFDVPAYKKTSWAEYVAAEENTPVVVGGIVTAIISKTNGNSYNCLYLEDADGAYYAYNLADDPVALGIEVGMEVEVSGLRSTYSGTYEIINCGVEIVSKDKKPVTPVDYTDKFKAAANLKDAALTEKQGSLVTIKNVVICPVDSDESNGYYKFQLGNNTSYARISSSVCPIVTEKDAFIKNFKEHKAYLANITGIICLYDGSFYLTPVTVDAFEYLSLSDVVFDEVAEPEADMSEAQTLAKAFALEEGEALVGTQVLRGEIVEIPTAYDEKYGNITVNIKVGEQIVQCFRLIGGQELKVGDVITVAGNLKNYKGTVEFDAKCTYSKDMTVDEMKQAKTLEAAFALGEGEVLSGRRVVCGTIDEIATAYDEKYGNISVWLKVGEQRIEAYRLIGGSELKVGDVITVTGNIKNYKGTVEFDAKCTYTK